MKKLILILLLFIANVNAQSNMLLLFESGGYQTETKQYIAALTTPLSKTRADTLDMFVKMLKDTLSISNLSGFFDRFWIFASPDTNSAGTSLVNPTSVHPTNTGSTPFVADQGYTPAFNKYLKSNFVPSTDGINYTLNSGSVGVYSRTDNNFAGTQIGGRGASNTKITQMSARNTSDAGTGLSINSETLSSSNNGSVTNSLGLFILTRVAASGAASVNFYHNGALVTGGGFTSTSTAVTDVQLYISGYNNNGTYVSYDTKQYAVVFISKGITAIQARGITNCIEWFLDAIGAGVIP